MEKVWTFHEEHMRSFANYFREQVCVFGGILAVPQAADSELAFQGIFLFHDDKQWLAGFSLLAICWI